MATYSNSKVSCFETCPYQYKLKYIDKVKIDVPTTIESFIGSLVHEALEKLYKDKKFQKQISLSRLLKFYKDLWEKEYSKDILIVKASQGLKADNYKKMGIKFITDYYNRMKPFEQLTILGLETTDRMTLPDGNQWHVRIDKLACDKEGNYYVCDYKTNARMKDQEEADSDRQLALYSIWVKDKFKDAKSVKLVWHMLAFDKDAVSERTDEQLEKLQQDVIDKIKEIETATKEGNFPRQQSGLCNYCGYKEMCPSFKHEVELEQKTIEEFKEDDGVKLVDEFSEIKTKLAELKKQDEEFKEKLINYSKQFGVDAIYGSNKVASLKPYQKVIYPEDKTEIIKLLKDKELWEEFAMINYSRFQSRAVKGEIDKDVLGKVEFEENFRISLRKRDDGEEGEE